MPKSRISAHPRRSRLMRLLMAVTGAAGAVLTAATPAHATTCELTFYYNDDGSSAWHSENVDSAGCASTPAMTRSSSATEIAITEPDGSLRFYWNNDGSSDWF